MDFIFRYITLLLVLIYLNTNCICQIVPSGFVEELVIDSLNPVTFTTDHHNRIWLAQKNGDILIVNESGRLNHDPFLKLDVDDFNERGLLGLALHPDMDTNPFVYVYYTVPGSNHNRISRFTANGDLAIPGSEEVLLNLDELQSGVHNAGAMLFDSAGYLYIATGDGGQPANAQDTTNLLGKILRLHFDGRIPNDNPYINSFHDKQRAIWSMGHRNPFNLAYDPIKHILYATDVGGGDFEEINRIEKSKNYGWPIVEGPVIDQSPPPNYQDPLYAYNHDFGCAIVGLNIYRPELSSFPDSYFGQLMFADYCEGYIKLLNPMSGVVTEDFAHAIDRPLHIDELHETGALYYLARAGLGGGSPGDNTATNTGSLWRVTYTGSGSPTISHHPQSQLISVHEGALFSVRVNGDPPFAYSWFVNDSMWDSDSNVLVIDQTSLRMDSSEIICIVTNHEGADTSKKAILFVTANQRPQPVILTPMNGSTFRAGDTIFFRGMVNDPEDGLIDSTNFNWQVDFHHDQHTHPIIENFQSRSSGYFIIPKTGETDTNTWYRIYLHGIDSQGLSNTTYVELFPELIGINIIGPSGLSINIDGRLRTLPALFSSLYGLNRTLLIPDLQKKRDRLFTFSHWDDGEEGHIRQVSATAHQNQFIIYFDSIQLGSGTGLIGEYRNDPEFDFDERPLYYSLDSIIDYNWGGSSPHSELINEDNFTIRWQGLIEPLTPGIHHFNTRSDDGVRLWIDDVLLIDDWNNHPPKRNTASMDFVDKNRVPIVLEYFDSGGGALIELSWSSGLLPEEIVPKSQLFPETFKDVRGRVWVDENTNDIFETIDIPLKEVTVLLFASSTNQLVMHTQSDTNGMFEFIAVNPATYYISLVQNDIFEYLAPHFGVNSAGFSATFHHSIDEEIKLDFIYRELHSDERAISNPLPGISIFPNPVTSHIVVDIADPRTLSQLTIFDSRGLELINRLGPFNHQIKLDLYNLNPGMYIIQCQTPWGLRSEKFIKVD